MTHNHREAHIEVHLITFRDEGENAKLLATCKLAAMMEFVDIYLGLL